MLDRRITNADFRPCSTDGSRSQAPFYVYALQARLPTGLRVPLRSSVTLWEETAPVKLPDEHGPDPGHGSVRTNVISGWYFTCGSQPGVGRGTVDHLAALTDRRLGRPSSPAIGC